MKFKPGNLLCHTRSKGLWIVVDVLPINKIGSRRRRTTFRLQMNAACVQPGIDRLNHTGDFDTWVFQQEDGSDHDDMWTVINEV